ncbi:glutamate-5-semialdehyde dehydrogenase [Pseudoxanthomonas sp. SGNA-20]|uniref:Gamma-glutamyl phosphate reductase n=1 Tax=Pseudoxanthomonas taiwanensis J19 TaxID=935569 RepID=A0A562D8Q3_9GAMM|nr:MULTISPECIES: glutamate-5-semialdehyde dehydrogenase [Pseudoxanthomonas]RRN55033.1 glutamate-5-semialdehyde dehydrogenase [Pseudoxanthomonas sp. SGNA-20]TWH06058.1 glutamate-5-semialdehyde dehydrogenase [Pseudoxanthomonas taiwanensis J19]
MSDIKTQALQAREAALAIAQLSTEGKNALLRAMADALEADAAAILEANARDIEAAVAKGVGAAMQDRLRLDDKRLQGVANALREVAELPDPVAQVTRAYDRPNGIHVERVRVPLGVIAMIYEARPNVTADAAALCLKAGNAVILRGGSEAIHSNTAIAAALKRALREAGLPEAVVTLVEDLRRETILELIQLNDIVDLVIPRGGEGLIRFVAEHARVPVIKHYKGVCHQYVDAPADLGIALELLVDGKVSRPAACNSLETLLVHADVAASFLPRAARELRGRGVELRGCERSRAIVPDMVEATEDDYAAEYLDLILAVRVVDGLEQAIEHIQRYTSDHTEVIVTADASHAERFVQALRSAVVMVNASSRFSDGGELGLGAEIGISTTRLHSYGPMGLEALTVERFVVRGEGQVRHPDLLAQADE